VLIVVKLYDYSILNIVSFIKYNLEPIFRSLSSQILFELFQRIRAYIIISK